MSTSVYGERIAAMEVEVKELKNSLAEHKRETAENFEKINQKLDDLLVLRNKGAGILWFVSGMFALATALIGYVNWK